MFITGYFAGLMKCVASSSNNKCQILSSAKPLLNYISVLIIHFEIAPVGVNRGYHWILDAELNSTAGKIGFSYTLNNYGFGNLPCTAETFTPPFQNSSIFDNGFYHLHLQTFPRSS
jgi:hypothetical protein